MDSVRFGTSGRFELQPARRRLLVDRMPARRDSRALDLLTLLVDECEHTVSRAELLDRVWPGVVVGPNNLECRSGRCGACSAPTRSQRSPGAATGSLCPCRRHGRPTVPRRDRPCLPRWQG